MKIVEQYQCPECYGLHDEKFNAQTCCEPKVETVFAFKNGQYFGTEKEAREFVYLTELQKLTPPLDARAVSDAVEVVYATE